MGMWSHNNANHRTQSIYLCLSQHPTATNCNTLQQTTTLSNTLQHTATHCNCRFECEHPRKAFQREREIGRYTEIEELSPSLSSCNSLCPLPTFSLSLSFSRYLSHTYTKISLLKKIHTYTPIRTHAHTRTRRHKHKLVFIHTHLGTSCKKCLLVHGIWIFLS